MKPKKFSEIVQDERAELTAEFAKAAPASELEPLPRGVYRCVLEAGELTETTRNQTLNVQLTFRVIDGQYAGRRFWHAIWVTPAAMGMAKRDLAKLGVSSLEQLDGGIAGGHECEVHLSLRKDDAGDEYNRVRKFTVIGRVAVEDPDFGPAGTAEGGAA